MATLSRNICFLTNSSYRLTHTASFFLKRKVKLPKQPSMISPYIIGPFLKEFPVYREPRPLADRIYEEIEQKEEVEPKLKIILLETVDELGVAGDVIETDRDYARFHLISAKKAAYADEFNLKRYRDLIDSGDKQVGPSSAFVMPTIKRLSKEVIVVTVNDQNSWTLSKNHVRIALRAAGYFVPNECITLPKTEINGPNIERYQGKDFAVTITINQQEQVNVRCLIHHKGLPLRVDWDREPRFVALPEEQSDILGKMPVKEAIQEDDL